VALTGTVDSYATAVIAELFGAGTLTQSGINYILNLGTLTASSSPFAIDLGVSNAAIGMADLLSGSFSIANSSGAFINNEDSAFAGLAAGQADIAPAVTLTAATDGAFIETITLNAIGSNADYSGTLAPETVTINGSVAPVIVLTTGVDVVNGANNVTIDAATNTLSGGDQINGGGGTNTLDLVGGGSFNLAAPAVLTDIQMVNATEGRSAAMPTIFLRNGTDLTLTLASAATDPQLAGAVVHRADNDNTINVGSGNDSGSTQPVRPATYQASVTTITDVTLSAVRRTDIIAVKQGMHAAAGGS
jgi:hypothetical protein